MSLGRRGSRLGGGTEPLPTDPWTPLCRQHSCTPIHPCAQVSIPKREGKPQLHTVLGTPHPTPTTNWFCLWWPSSGKAIHGSMQSSCGVWKAVAGD